jgi:hypothetical protein
VERVWAVVLFRVESNIVDGVFAVANTVDVASGDCIVDGMSGVDG